MRTLLLILSVSLFCAGCMKPVPDEMKNLCPATIRVVKGGEPVQGAIVSLRTDRDAGILVRSGVTDSGGNATIRTKLRDRFGVGVQAGAYTVTVRKNIPLPPELRMKDSDIELPEKEQERLHAKRQAFLDKNRIVPVVLTKESTSPIELTVMEKEGLAETIDLSKY